MRRVKSASISFPEFGRSSFNFSHQGKPAARKFQKEKKSRAEKMNAHRNSHANVHFRLVFEIFLQKWRRKHSGRFSIQPQPWQSALMQKQGHIQKGCAARRFAFTRRGLRAQALGRPNGFRRKRFVAPYCTLLHPIALCVFEPPRRPACTLQNSHESKGDNALGEKFVVFLHCPGRERNLYKWAVSGV